VHREHARTREVDIQGLALPSWQQIVDREYEPWDRDHLIIDTAIQPVAQVVAAILGAAEIVGGPPPGYLPRRDDRGNGEPGKPSGRFGFPACPISLSRPVPGT
jgi:hypothetical protein